MSRDARAGVPFHRLHTLVTYAIAGLGLFALTRGEQIGAVGSLFFAAGYVGSWFGASSRPRAPMDLERRSSFWNGMMLAALVLQGIRFFLGAAILKLAFELAGGLQIAKLFNRSTAKDHQQIQALAFLHLIGASVLTTGLDYAVIFFGFVVLTPWMLALTQMRAEIERHYGGVASGESAEEQRSRAATIARVLRSRRIAGPGFLLGTAALALPLFLVTAAFFLLFPRVGMGFLSFGAEAGQPVAGFGPNVELGKFGVIRDDPTVILRVSPHDLADDPAPTRTFRLRGTSFDTYRDARWTRMPTPPARLPTLMDGYVPLSVVPEERADHTYEIVLDPLAERVVFVLPGTIGLSSPKRIESGIDRNRRFVHRFGGEVRYADPDGLPLRYTLYTREEGAVPSEELPPEERRRYLQLPPGQERVAALAREIAGEGGERTRARRLEAWLRDSGELRYSLELPDTRGADPLEVFLFDARRGHCEYFSTALAIMLRSEGIPSRNVTGFVGGTYNQYGRYYAVRQGDAHSWVEAWIDERWVVLDPTPAAREGIGASEGLLSELSEALDALRMRWSRDVVGYDLRDQVTGLRRFFRFVRSLRGDRAQGGAEGARPQGSAGSSMSAGRLLIAGLVLLALVGSFVWWRRRRSGPRRVERGGRSDSPSARDATRLYRHLERRLKEVGHPRPPSRTPREHLDVLRSESVEGYEVAQAITEAYLAARYGGQPLDGARRRDLKRRLRQLK